MDAVLWRILPFRDVSAPSRINAYLVRWTAGNTGGCEPPKGHRMLAGNHRTPSPPFRALAMGSRGCAGLENKMRRAR